MSAPATTDSPACPPGFKIHTENSAKILLPDEATAFLNPIQEFNRDLSVACITTWSKRWDAVRRERWEQGGAKRERGKKKRKGVNEDKPEVPVLEGMETDSTAPGPSEDASKTVGGTNGNAQEKQKEASRVVYRISLIFIN